jgi:hypothetical protein
MMMLRLPDCAVAALNAVGWNHPAPLLFFGDLQTRDPSPGNSKVPECILVPRRLLLQNEQMPEVLKRDSKNHMG